MIQHQQLKKQQADLGVVAVLGRFEFRRGYSRGEEGRTRANNQVQVPTRAVEQKVMKICGTLPSKAHILMNIKWAHWTCILRHENISERFNLFITIFL
jgi:hypothetical protein